MGEHDERLTTGWRPVCCWDDGRSSSWLLTAVPALYYLCKHHSYKHIE